MDNVQNAPHVDWEIFAMQTLKAAERGNESERLTSHNIIKTVCSFSFDKQTFYPFYHCDNRKYFDGNTVNQNDLFVLLCYFLISLL